MVSKPRKTREGCGEPVYDARKKKLDVKRKLVDVQKIIEQEMFLNAGYYDFAFLREAATSVLGKIELGMEAARKREWQEEKANLKKSIAERDAASAARLARAQDETSHVRKDLKFAMGLYLEKVMELRDARAKLEEQETMASSQREECKIYKARAEELAQQIEEECLCIICKEKPRDTFVLPCSHFQYCLPCLLAHRDRNGNTCPVCRGPIEGLCQSSNSSSRKHKADVK